MSTQLPQMDTVRVRDALRRSESKKALSDGSIRTYTYHIRKLRDAVPGDIWAADYPPLDEYQRFLDTIKPSSRMPLAFSVVRFAEGRENGCSHMEALRSCADGASQAKEASRPDPNVPSAWQAENMVEWSEIKKVLNDRKSQLRRLGILHGSGQINEQGRQLLRSWVIGMLYAGSPDQPPRRLEFRNVVVDSEEVFKVLPKEVQESGNYLIVKSRNKKRWLFNDYKTSGSYGPYEAEVPKEVNTALNTWFKYNPPSSSAFLFGEEAIPRQTFGDWIAKAFAPCGKFVRVNTLRHSYLTSKYEPDAVAREEDARRMGHSVSTQVRYILKEKD